MTVAFIKCIFKMYLAFKTKTTIHFYFDKIMEIFEKSFMFFYNFLVLNVGVDHELTMVIIGGVLIVLPTIEYLYVEISYGKKLFDAFKEFRATFNEPSEPIKLIAIDKVVKADIAETNSSRKSSFISLPENAQVVKVYEISIYGAVDLAFDNEI